MKPLFTQIEYNSTKSTDKLPCQCYNCNNTFYSMKVNITAALNKSARNSVKFCSISCKNIYRNTNVLIFCSNCNLEFKKPNYLIKKSKNHFCSQSCAATYNNKHKSHGNRRSKLEIWLETELQNIYPNLKFKFNDKLTIKSELDIYIPSLNLAFELNGIFHYEPIFGEQKFNQILMNDKSKTKACIDNQIDLCVIDTSQLKYFKPKNGEKYLKIITTIINKRTMLNS